MLATALKTCSDAAPRAKTTLDHVDFLDGWRGLAILLVLQSHFLGISEIDSGRLGVDVFFCLSGLLMSELLFLKRTSLSLFYRRRVSRILPAFLVFNIAIYGYAYLIGNGRPWSEFFSTLTFLRSYLPTVPGLWQVALPIGHLWSLNVEEHCYILMSALTLFAVIRGIEGRALIVLALVFLGIHVAYVVMPSVAPSNYGIHTEVVAPNILLSAGYRLFRDRAAKWIPAWSPLASFGLASIFYCEPIPTATKSLIAPFLLAFTVNHLQDSPRFFRRILSLPVARLFGIWSYSLYLWLQPFTAIQHKVIGGSVVAFAMNMAVGLLSIYFLENPVRRWLNSRWTPSGEALPKKSRNAVHGLRGQWAGDGPWHFRSKLLAKVRLLILNK